MKDVGKLIIKLEYDKLYIQKVELWVPSLSLNAVLKMVSEFDKIPKGRHRAVLTIYRTTGKPVKQNVVLEILPEKNNFQIFNLYDIPQEVVIRPVDAADHTILNAEIKVEGMDTGFRPIHDEKGVAYTLRPGKYEVKVVLPNLEVKTFPLDIAEEHSVYMLPVEEKEEHRNAPRVELSIPLGYRTPDGTWFSTKSINISSTGMCLIKQSTSGNDEQVYVRLLLPDSQFLLECNANVRWTKKGLQPTMGLELIIDEQTKGSLRRWLRATSEMQSKAHNFLRR